MKNISIVHTVIDHDGAERVLVIDFIIFMQKYLGRLKTIQTLKIFGILTLFSGPSSSFCPLILIMVMKTTESHSYYCNIENKN